MAPKILILDYSVNKESTAVISACLPKNAEVTSFFIDTEDSFPINLLDQKFTHVIHSGSELSINDESPFFKRAVRLIRAAVGREVWQMGICYGHQLLCKVLVGDHAIRKVPRGFEAGWKKVWFLDYGRKLLGVNGDEMLWQHHFDEVVELPMWSELLATNDHSHVQAFINHELKILGTQFHPEFTHESGNQYFLNDRENLEAHGFNVEEMIQQGPSCDNRKVFFEFFLGL